MNGRETSVSDNEEDYDKARFFVEDVQSIAADYGVDMEISLWWNWKSYKEVIYSRRLLWI